MPEPERMKIAFVSDVIYPYVKGGVEKRVWELSVRLAARGHDVHIFGMKYWDGDDILIREGVILHGVCPSRPLYANGRRTVGEAIMFSLRLIPHMRKYRIRCDRLPAVSLFLLHFNKSRFPLWKNSACDHMARSLGRVLVHVIWLGAGAMGKFIECRVARAHSPRDRGFQNYTGTATLLGHQKSITIIPNGVDQKRIAAISPQPTDRISSLPGA